MTVSLISSMFSENWADASYCKTSENAHVSPTPRVTFQKADITRRTLQADCRLGLG